MLVFLREPLLSKLLYIYIYILYIGILYLYLFIFIYIYVYFSTHDFTFKLNFYTNFTQIILCKFKQNSLHYKIYTKIKIHLLQ